jgi:hypothetical protein
MDIQMTGQDAGMPRSFRPILSARNSYLNP